LTNVIECRNLVSLYTNGKGIESVTFNLQEGEILCVFGRNGSGKSTLMRVLSTLCKPQKGKCYVLGAEIAKNRNLVRKSVFTVFDENSHFEFTTGMQNLAFFMKMYGSNRFNEIKKISDHFNLDLDINVNEYSLGMKRKLYLIEAFLSERKILLFDEPTLGLDSETRDVFFNFLKECKANNISILFGTNRIEETKYADRILFLDNGKLQQVNNIDAIISNLVTVKFFFKDQEVTDYISSVDELPDIVKKYLSVGIPNRIAILTNEKASTSWTNDALEKVERAPKFVRPMVYKMVENYAQEKGYQRITSEVVEEARRRYETK
jgi:ABC-type multidrug transport system ATPase subunit